ncbi:MAG: helix-turn-helix transcriptional regulator [Bacteroidota bacterium]
MKSSLDSKTKTVAGNIRRIRVFRNYTQDYLAMKLDITQNAYSKIELGYSNITLNRLISIAEVLDIDPVTLISCEGDQLLQIRKP